ncbi:hypothetical protein CEXT_189921 [Caerostris extrusa]|uniref:Uncharacterized protein n=1 Tax=Caerostris extrusa TaxID=172846 RepID=A0AAV4RDU0_CAEEX|nr:hypothetical protein CEXT_189921 [Caerostris extrusa]
MKRRCIYLYGNEEDRINHTFNAELNSLLQLTRVINHGDDDFSYWAKNKERVLPTVGEWPKEICYRIVAGHVHLCSAYERLRKLYFHLSVITLRIRMK